MDERDWEDEDEEYEAEPYVIIEKQESAIGPFLLGIALGAGVALLFAPQSGEETRGGIARSARRAKSAAQDLVDEAFKEFRARKELAEEYERVSQVEKRWGY